jgi:PAS domain S-box-containing protein
MTEQGFLASDYVELFFSLFQHTSDAVYIIGLADGVILDANEAFLSLYGLPRQQAIGASVVDLGLWVYPEDRTKLVERLKAERKVIDFRTRMRNVWSEEFQVSVSDILAHWRGDEVVLGITRVLRPGATPP